MDKQQTTSLLIASIAKTENEKRRSEFNVSRDLALQIVDLKKELMKYRTALTEIRFADDLQTAVEVADKALK